MDDGRTGERTVFAEDLPTGEHLPLGSHELTEAEIIDFASTWDPQFFHVDPAASAEGPFAGLIASGIHTLAVFQRLVVEAHFSGWNIVAGKRIDDLCFLRPVRPGDVLTGHLVVEDVVHDERGRAEFVCRGTLTNQDGKDVLTLVLTALIAAR